MKFRTRVATVVSAALLLGGLGAGVHANAAAPTVPLQHQEPKTHGCVYIELLDTGFCFKDR